MPRGPLKHAIISHASSGDNTIVENTSSEKRVVVLNYILVAAGAVTAQWQDEGANLSGAMALAANGGVSATGSQEEPLMETAKGSDLQLNLGGAVAVAGHLTYELRSY